MSADPKEPKVDDPVAQVIKGLKVDVDRTQIEKDLQKELETQAVEKAELNKKLEEYAAQLEELRKKDEQSTEAYTKLKEETDTAVNSLHELAMEDFQKKKDGYLKMLTDSGMEDDKITELDERLQTPADLDAMEWQISFIQEQLDKANKERANLTKEQQDALDEQKRKDAAALAAQPSGGGKVPLNEPSKKFVYSSANPYREAIDDLYDRDAKGDKEAKKLLDRMWKQFATQIKDFKKSFSITECVICGGGIMAGEKCPYCDFDPADYIITENPFK